MNRWIVPVAGGGVVVALLVVGVLAAVDDGPGQATAQAPTTVAPTTVSATPAVTRTVTVDGVGVVSGIPDTVTLSLGVNVDRTSAADVAETLHMSSGRVARRTERLLGRLRRPAQGAAA